MDTNGLQKIAVLTRTRAVAVLGQRVPSLVRGLAVQAPATARRLVTAARRLPRGARIAILGAALTLLGAWELRTSALEARILSGIASALTYTVQPGPSRWIVFPRGGPLDEQRGYSRIAEFSRRLEPRGYRVAAQARFSPALAVAARSGVAPPYREPNAAGLLVLGAGGDTLYDATAVRAEFERFEDIPPVIVKALLFIENRELDKNPGGTVNPAVDWPRFLKAALIHTGRQVGLPLRAQGGSTLAVQLEKYRHSPGGRTASAPEKLRQMLTASLRAYRDGPHTAKARQEVVLAYVNTAPLGGAPGYGEVHGLPEGLRVWFGLDPWRTCRTIAGSGRPARRARALKPVLALLCAVRAPSEYLGSRSAALEARVESYTRLLREAGVIDSALAQAMLERPLRLSPSPAGAWRNRVRLDKGTRLVREEVRSLLGVPDAYALDRLHVRVESTLDPVLQREASRFFRSLGDEDSVRTKGLVGERLLGAGDPGAVLYSLLLRERTPSGNVARVEVDNIDQPFDLNGGTKLELGSTAKLRTLVHYLDLVARERSRLAGLDREELAARAEEARDPISRWVAAALADEPGLGLDSLLQRALDRTYRANPRQIFYTGGGLTAFRNFDSDDDGDVVTIREAAVRSTNLVFIRLMRDLVRYHAVRLPYDPDSVLAGGDVEERTRLLREAADQGGAPEDTAWLFRTRDERAREMRLRAQIERDAFAAMTADWRRLGFPFSNLVPSYATAIGSSGDRPAALADLMAILVNDGVVRRTSRVRRITFAPGTPYETTYEAPSDTAGERVLDPSIARVARGVLAEVVEQGTARRISDAFVDSAGAPVLVGGKTGTGDNRHETYGPGGRVTSSRAINRTATFVFFLGDRYYGVITATVLGPRAASYQFTSALPVSLLRNLAPEIENRLQIPGVPEPVVTLAEAPAQAPVTAPPRGSAPRVAREGASKRDVARPVPPEGVGGPRRGERERDDSGPSRYHMGL